MIKKYNNLSFVWGIPGLILQGSGHAANQPLLMVIGTILLMLGFIYYAKSKGRSPVWCLMGFLSIVGLIILAFLKDLTVEKTQ